MKKKITFIAIAMILSICVVLSGCKKDDNTEDSESRTMTSIQENVSEDSNEVNKDFTDEAGGNPKTSELNKEFTDEAGENLEDSNSFVLEITVSEDKYFIENHEKDYAELIEEIKLLSDDSSVILYDEKATLKAVKTITDYLNENEVKYHVEISD